MNLKNYTSTVPAVNSIRFIENKLAGYGALSLSKWFDERGMVVGITFVLNANGVVMTFKIPANIDKVEKRMIASKARPPKNKESMRIIREQAERTAWKIMSDWISIQLSLVDIDQVDTIEIFLPYIFDGKQTYYEHLKDGNFKDIAQLTHNQV